MLKSFRTEIDLTLEQKARINRTIGTCRYVYNFYLAHNRELHGRGERFMTGKGFSVWLNNEYLPHNPDKAWIKDVSSKAVKKSIENGYAAFVRFFKHQGGFPKFKKDGYVIRSGAVSVKAGRYYVSALVEVPDKPHGENSGEGIGVDLGVKEFAVCSNGRTYPNINKTERVRKLEKRLRREQRRLSRKYEHAKRTQHEHGSNICRQRLKVQKFHRRMDDLRSDYVNKTIAGMVKAKPSYIAIEDLNVSGMMRNRHLSKAVASQKFHEFRTRLKSKCDENGIELRIVDRWYPSSKLCHRCGSVREGLRLSDRTYECGCGYTQDRDFNASLNLRDATAYETA